MRFFLAIALCASAAAAPYASNKFLQVRLDEHTSTLPADFAGRASLGYDEMLSHEFLTPDHAVQETRWKSGAVVVVNFGDTAFRTHDGRTVEPMQSLVRGVKE